MVATEFATTQDEAMSRDWHYHPELPIATSAVFSWPPKPLQMVAWLAKSWLRPSDRTLWLAMALATWAWFQPPLEQMKSFAWDWVVYIYVRNLIVMTIIAGGLHLYFYTFGRQGMRRRFDKRGLAANSRRFTFNNQVLDNMFWTLASGVTVWTAYEVLYFWLVANGHLPTLTWADNPVWFVALFVMIPLWSSVHFYWIHRLIHWPPLYRAAHALHHRNVVTGPWSGISMHPIEHLIYFSSVILHFVVASHPVHMMFHFYVLSLNPACEHSGYEGIEIGGRNRFQLGNFFHQLHHRYFKCNYGTSEMPWDKWFGSFHDGTPEATARIQRRRW